MNQKWWLNTGKQHVVKFKKLKAANIEITDLVLKSITATVSSHFGLLLGQIKFSQL